MVCSLCPSHSLFQPGRPFFHLVTELVVRNSRIRLFLTLSAPLPSCDLPSILTILAGSLGIVLICACHPCVCWQIFFFHPPGHRYPHSVLHFLTSSCFRRLFHPTAPSFSFTPKNIAAPAQQPWGALGARGGALASSPVGHWERNGMQV